MAVQSSGLETLAEALLQQGFCANDELGLSVIYQRPDDLLKVHLGTDGSFTALDGNDEVQGASPRQPLVPQAQDGMSKSRSADFDDRLKASAEAKKLQLERAARAISAADSPAAVERRAARAAVSSARVARIAERKATRAAAEAQQAASLIAARGAEAAAREAALKAEEEAREAEYTRGLERQAALEAEQLSARDARYAARKAKRGNGR